LIANSRRIQVSILLPLSPLLHESIALAHVQVLLEDANARPATPEPWMGHFRDVHPALRGTKSWSKKLRKLSSTSKKQDGGVVKAFAGLGTASPKSFKQAVDMLLKLPLAHGAEGLGLRLKEIAGENAIDSDLVASIKTTSLPKLRKQMKKGVNVQVKSRALLYKNFAAPARTFLRPMTMIKL